MEGLENNPATSTDFKDDSHYSKTLLNELMNS